MEHADTADEAIHRIKNSPKRYDLIITHYGYQENGPPAAVSILRALRKDVDEEKSCPVIVFSLPIDIDKRKQEVIRLGAQNYCVTYKSLLQSIERLVSPAGQSV